VKPLPDLAVWRHPRPIGAEGRCVGRIDLAVDPRRVRRLARCLERTARREARPRVVFTSPATRCRAVGRWLRRRGWVHRVDARLQEADFGRWDGRRWDAIGRLAIEAWVREFATHRPGGGETVGDVLERCRSFLSTVDPVGALVVTHGGWISALEWIAATSDDLSRLPAAVDWPRAVGYGRRWQSPRAVSADRIPGCG
jgi:alpha-ribazole phosphatase